MSEASFCCAFYWRALLVSSSSRGCDGTRQPTRRGFGEVDGLFQERAREALPLLVRQAKAGQTIYYSDLAAELNMPNARNLKYVVGYLDGELELLSKRWGQGTIPPLQCLVINRSTQASHSTEAGLSNDEDGRGYHQGLRGDADDSPRPLPNLQAEGEGQNTFRQQAVDVFAIAA